MNEKEIKQMERMNINIKKAVLEVLEVLFDQLDCEEKSVKEYYGRTGEQVQAKKWNSERHDYDLQYDENGEAIMEYVYDYIPKTSDEISDTDKAKMTAIDAIRKALEKLI